MAADNHTTIVGNLVDDPELRFTNNGIAVANLRVAVTQRILQDGEWRDGETSFLRVNVWRGQAEHLTESLGKGDRVMVTGRLRQRTWETPEGDKRSVTELEADEVGASLKWATAKNLCEYRRPRLLLRAYCLPSRMGTGAEHQHVPPEQPAANDTPRQQRRRLLPDLAERHLGRPDRRPHRLLRTRVACAGRFGRLPSRDRQPRRHVDRYRSQADRVVGQRALPVDPQDHQDTARRQRLTQRGDRAERHVVDAGQAAVVVVVAFWQNTATRKLTMEMLDSVFRRPREILDIPAQDS